jgi:peptidoglycan/xylan/chitin deacetylase (PgdA/CDA1 family)
MLVPRRVAPLMVGVIPLLVPTLGGSDVSRASQLELDDPPLAALEAEAAGGPGAVATLRAPITLWSPGHGPHTRFMRAPSRRELLLSFDDGPDLRGTPMILDELDRRGLKAIFFVTGWRMTGRRPEDQARRDLLRKIAAHGHLVANHTMTHHNLCENPNETASEIDRNAELIQQATGVRPLLFRSPYGAFCKSLEAALVARELPDVGWNLDPQDWKHDSEAAVYAYLTDKLAHLEGRGILLLHDTHLASVHALPRVLDWLARENERAVQEGRAPVQIIDYSALVPRRPVAESGFERLVTALAEDVAGDLATSFARISP